MISLKNVSKSFGLQSVLKDFSLDIHDGAKIAIMGRSGAGKTTLLNLVMGLLKPDSGSVNVPKGTGIGAVFQEDRLIESLTAVANCRLVMKKGADSAKASELLSRLGLADDLASKSVSDLSGGERRRVAIARALLSEPDVIILDEPFKGIDSETLPVVIDEVNYAASGKTLILVTHSAAEAEALGCNIITI